MNFVVTFDREVTETATLIVEANSREKAIDEALKLLTEHDWAREKVSQPSVVVRPIRKR